MKTIGNNVILALYSVVFANLLIAESSTPIGRFVLKRSECKGVKVFENNTQKSLVVKWQVTCPISDASYIQSPLIASGTSCTLDFEKAVKFIESKTRKKCDNFELDLFLGVVTKAPVRPRTQFDYRALRFAEKGLSLTKNEFLSHKVFELYQNEQGQFYYKGDAVK